MIERILGWQLYQINCRREAKVEADMVNSAMRYGIIVANVEDLDHSIAQLERIKNSDTRRKKAARRYGRWIANLFNPQGVHFRSSGIMPEAVVLAERRSGQQIMDEWGKASSLDPDADYEYFDYMDWDVRIVWVNDDKGEKMLLPKEMWEHKMTFFPWVTVSLGTDLESAKELKYKPMLYQEAETDRWKNQNIIKSIRYSDILARASYPRFAEEGNNPQEVTMINYLDPSRIAKVPIGDSLRQLAPEQGDPALRELDQDLMLEISKSTLSKIILGGEFPSGTAFSTLNLATQTSVGQLKPYKQLAERGLAEMFKVIMMWVEYTGKDLVAYGTDRMNAGFQYVLKADEIDPNGLYIDVELDPDIPIDKQQRINAAVMAKQLGMSNETALEGIGISDPEEEMMLGYLEQLVQNKLKTLMQTEQQQAQLGTQMEAQMMMQQAQMGMQQEQMVVQPGTAPPPMPGIPGVEGMGYSPNEGGLPPAMVMPEATMEQQGAMDRSGNPVIPAGQMIA
jgi:hypothetical protein